MRPTEPFDKRTLHNRKTFPKSGRVRGAKNGIDRDATMKRGNRKAGFRSNFELDIAKKLSGKKIPYEYEDEAFYVRAQTTNIYTRLSSDKARYNRRGKGILRQG